MDLFLFSNIFIPLYVASACTTTYIPRAYLVFFLNNCYAHFIITYLALHIVLQTILYCFGNYNFIHR